MMRVQVMKFETISNYHRHTIDPIHMIYAVNKSNKIVEIHLRHRRERVKRVVVTSTDMFSSSDVLSVLYVWAV